MAKVSSPYFITLTVTLGEHSVDSSVSRLRTIIDPPQIRQSRLRRRCRFRSRHGQENPRRSVFANECPGYFYWWNLFTASATLKKLQPETDSLLFNTQNTRKIHFLQLQDNNLQGCWDTTALLPSQSVSVWFTAGHPRAKETPEWHYSHSHKHSISL